MVTTIRLFGGGTKRAPQNHDNNWWGSYIHTQQTSYKKKKASEHPKMFKKCQESSSFFLFLVGLYVYQTEIRERKVCCLAPFQQKKVKWNRHSFVLCRCVLSTGSLSLLPGDYIRVRGGRFITQQERKAKKIVSKENSRLKEKRLDISLYTI